MTDGHGRNRRRYDDEPISVGELARWLERHEIAAERLHAQQLRMIEKLDARSDLLAQRIAIAFGVVAILWAVFVILAPFVREFLGIANSG